MHPLQIEMSQMDQDNENYDSSNQLPGVTPQNNLVNANFMVIALTINTQWFPPLLNAPKINLLLFSCS